MSEYIRAGYVDVDTGEVIDMDVAMVFAGFEAGERVMKPPPRIERIIGPKPPCNIPDGADLSQLPSVQMYAYTLGHVQCVDGKPVKAWYYSH